MSNEPESPTPDPGSEEGDRAGLRYRRLSLVVPALAFFACGAVALTTNDPLVRWLNLAICVVTAAGIVQLVRVTRSGRP